MDYKEWLSSLGEAVAGLGRDIAASLPALVAATALLVGGWLVAWLLRLATRRLVARVDRLVPGRTVRREIESSRVEPIASRAVGGIVFWVVFLFFLAAAGEVLGLAVSTAGLSRFAQYLPNLLAAVLIVLAGLVLSNLARAGVARASASAGLRYGEALGQGTRITILVLVSVVALDQIGIDSTLIILAVNIIIAAVCGGVALAFGLGARTEVSNLLSLHYVSQTYQIGQSVRLGEVQGKILSFTSTGVMVETAEGRVLVPGKEFSENVSILLREAG